MTARRITAAGLMLHHVRQQAMLWSGVLGAVVSGALAGVAAQYCLKLLIDSMAADPRVPAAVTLRLGAFLGLLGLEIMLLRLAGWMGSRAVIRLGQGVRLDLFQMAGTQPPSFAAGTASGAVGSRIRAGSEAAVLAARTLIWNVVPPCADLLGSVAVLAAVDWRLGAGLVAAVGLLFAGLHHVGLQGFPLHHAHHREAARVAGDLADTLANIGLVHAHGALDRERVRLAALASAEGRAHSRSWMFLERLRAGHDAAFWLVTAGMMSAAVLAWSGGAITTGGVILVSTISLRVLSGSRELALSALGLVHEFGAASEAVNALSPAPWTAPNTGRRPTVPPNRGTPGALALRSVHFAPGDGRPLFRALDLVVPPGQRIGIVGPSGAGKSTLLRLVQGLVLPDGGEVSLCGKPLATFARDELAAVFASVTQDVALLHRSIAENIRHGRPDAPWGAVLAAAEAAGCAGFIAGSPDGYDTLVGERGLRLSGGQRQRIAIARALLRDAPILLLDEATSALDSHAEAAVQQALRQCLRGRTLLAVTHRLSTVLEFDRVIVLQDGLVTEDGPPSALQDGAGWFATTLRLQRGLLEQETNGVA